MIRDIFDTKNTSKLTQGSVFNYAFDERYSEYEILGTIISARCDIANSKVDSYCFLPTLPIKVWLEVDIKDILKREHIKSIEGQIKAALSSHGLSENSISIYGTDSVKTLLLEKERKPAKREQIIQSFEKLESLGMPYNHGKIASLFSSEIKETIKKIIENKNSDYFFIDEVGEYGSCVIKLRSIRNLNSNVAQRICSGIEISEIADQDTGLITTINTKNKDSLSCIIGSIRSPYIELILQRFSDNFTRVGVENHHHSIIEAALERGLS